MSKSRKPYVVRGFDVTQAGPFTSAGALEAQLTFVERVVDRQHDAVTALLTGPIGTMAAHRLRASNDPSVTVIDLAVPMSAPITGAPIAAVSPELNVIDLKVITTASDRTELRSLRSEIREILKRWAEKSRVPGARGWRSSALKTPKFEHDPTLNCVTIKTQVVLGTAVFYNEHRATVGMPVDFQQAVVDLTSLQRHLQACLGAYYKTLYYSHSQFGKGEVV